MTHTDSTGHSLDIAKLRVLNQGLGRPAAGSAREVVERMGMVQAQDLEMALWAVGCRMRRPSRRAVVEALNRGEIIRMHLARHTWQLAVAEDVRGLIELYRERNLTGILSWARQNGHEISRQMISESEAMLREILEGSEGLTMAEIAPSYKSIGIEDQRLVRHLIFTAEVGGTICSGAVKGRDHTYALLNERVPPATETTKNETLVRLADRYFRSHAPATLDDFVWWTGLTKTECRAAVEAIAGRLTDAGGYFIHNEGVSSRLPRDFTLFLPPYDELLIGYKTRQHTIAPEHQPHAFNTFGIFRPVVLSGRQITGNWSRQTRSATFFADPASPESVEKAKRRYEAFLKS